MPMYRGRAPQELQVAIRGPEQVESDPVAFRCARILPVTGAPIEDGVILCENGRIVALGRADEVTIPERFQSVDCGDSWCSPGFVDLHCHIAGSSGGDINDTLHQTNPEMRTLDLIGLNHPQMELARAGGITTVMFIPGSGANVGGFGTLIKTGGRSPEEALIQFPGCVKIAQGGNPTRRSGDLGITHLGMNQALRMGLAEGYRYYRAWEDWAAGAGPKPERKPALEYMRGLFRHEYPACVHSQYYQVFQRTLAMLRVEFDLWTVIVHGTFDAYRLSAESRALGVPICNGPRQYHFDQNQSRFIGLATAWTEGGMHGWREYADGLGIDGIGINTDSPVVPQEELQLQAAMAVRLGLDDAVGLRAVTLNPAVFIRLEDRVGSLEPGKDADLVFWTGDPIDPRSAVLRTVVNGRTVYERDPGRPKW